MWAIVPFDVGRDYAMWASITVKQQMWPTSQRNRRPHHTGISGPHHTGITGPLGPEYATAKVTPSFRQRRRSDSKRETSSQNAQNTLMLCFLCTNVHRSRSCANTSGRVLMPQCLGVADFHAGRIVHDADRSADLLGTSEPPFSAHPKEGCLTYCFNLNVRFVFGFALNVYIRVKQRSSEIA
jgi:hypothetical protein